MSARLLRITGRVQGVGFRYSLAQEARRMQLSGWVRNRTDGSVEALLQGPAAGIATVERWARQGPPAARVLHVEAADAVEIERAGFEERPSA